MSTMAPPPPALSIRDLVVEAETAGGIVRLVDGVSLDVGRGEVVSVVGESGSGKSVTMLAVMGLLPPNAWIAEGEVVLSGRNLAHLGAAELQKVRGADLAMIFQEPMTSLNPVLTVARQIGEAIRVHNPGLARAAVAARTEELLSLVGVPDAARRMRQHPHEFSGGMRQRAMIAMAIANNPAVLVADEPTTALDVTIQAQVMDVLARVRERTGAAMVLVTHDLGLVAENADRVAVMYAGRLVEAGPAEDVFERPRHPYTASLLKSLPRLDAPADELFQIPGQPPSPASRPPGCVFHPRCPLARGRSACREIEPRLRCEGGAHRVACHFPDETAAIVAAGAGGAP